MSAPVGPEMAFWPFLDFERADGMVVMGCELIQDPNASKLQLCQLFSAHNDSEHGLNAQKSYSKW